MRDIVQVHITSALPIRAQALPFANRIEVRFGMAFPGRVDCRPGCPGSAHPGARHWPRRAARCHRGRGDEEGRA